MKTKDQLNLPPLSIPMSFIKILCKRIGFVCVAGKQATPESSSMTRKKDLVGPACQITCCIETNGSLCGKRKPLHTIEDILNVDEENHNSQLTDSNALRNTLNTADLTPVELTKDKEGKDRSTIKTEFKYVSLRSQLKKKAESGAVRYNRRIQKCYFGIMSKDKVGVVPVRRTKSVDRCHTMNKNAHGISESSVFFSPIGEWTIIDLNPKIFEKEDAKRTLYLRRKRASYKEVEPENICRIL